MGAFAAEATGEGITPERLIGCGMGEIVSFRRARIKAERRLAEKTASANRLKSPVVKRSIVIAGHKTSVSLEDAFWKGLKEIANGRDMTLSDLVAAIDSERQHGNLSSAIRLFVLDFYRNQLSDHKAGRDTPRDVIAVRAASSA